MLLRTDRLTAHLQLGLQPLYLLLGDEPLLMQEIADELRAAARRRGCDEREVFTVAGAHFDWSGVLGAAREMSLFASDKLIEIRIPTGRPGKDGAEALQRYVDRLPDGVVTLVMLPRLDGASLKSAWFAALDAAGVQLRVDGVPRAALPAWIAARLMRQGQHVDDGPGGERALAFFADRVEGNLLAAHQEIQKLALLYPPGLLTVDAIESAVLDVARYDIRQLCAATLGAEVSRALRILQGLRDEGESAVAVHWQLSNDLRDLARVRAALDAGRPLPAALAQARVFGMRQQLIERAVARFGAPPLRRLLAAAAVCDGITKGLPRRDWPAEPWEALRRLVLLTLQVAGAAARSGARPPAALALRSIVG